MVTWEDFRVATRVIGSGVRTATLATLDAFQERTGFRFPDRYLEFALTYGAGSFLLSPYRQGEWGSERQVWLFIPVGPNSPRRRRQELDDLNQDQDVQNLGLSSPPGDSSTTDLTTTGARPGRTNILRSVRNLLAGNQGTRRRQRPPARQRLVLFASDVQWGGIPIPGQTHSAYGWNPDEITDPSAREYAIYRVGPEKTPERVASSFQEFFLEYHLGPLLTAWVASGRPSDADLPNHGKPRTDPSVGSPILFFADTVEPGDIRLEAEPVTRSGDPAGDAVDVTRRIILAPTRGPGREVFFQEVLPDDTVSMQVWMATDAADEARRDAFWDRCQAIDWSDGQVHEVVSTEARPAVWTRPTAPPARPSRRDQEPRELTAEGLIRRGSRSPAPVAESWRRIEAWAFEHCPELLAFLLPGASAAEIAQFEAAIGQTLPADVRESYQIHDGMLDYLPTDLANLFRADEDAPYPMFAEMFFFWVKLNSIGPGKRRNQVLQQWNRPGGGGQDEGREDSLQDTYGHCKSFPIGAIRLRDSSRGWIPLTASAGNQDSHIGVDLDPGPTGTVGQVITFGSRDYAKYVLALSWGQFLEDYADELEVGHVTFVAEEPGSEHSQGSRVFALKAHSGETQGFRDDHWSQAKLPAEFQAITAASLPQLVAADNATATACRAVVAGFLAEYHAHQVRWRRLFQLDELGFQSASVAESGEFRAAALPLDEFAKQGTPVPESARFVSSKASLDPVKRAEFYRSLTVTGLARTARDEYDAILDRFGTTRVRTRARRSSLLVSRWDKYNSEEFKLGKVWSRDTQSAFVVCRQGEGARLRFLLKLEDEGWRLELKQTLDATAKKVKSTHEIWH